MRPQSIKIFALTLVSVLGVLACDLSSIGLAQANKPQILIQSPALGSEFREGDEVSIVSLATDAKGIVRVELSVDGVVVRTDAPPIPQGQTSFTLAQIWKVTTGAHTLSVRAFNAAGGASDPAFLSINGMPAVVGLPTAPIIPLATPLLSSSSASSLASSLSSSASAQPAATRTATRPAPSPTVNAPPDVYAVSIRVEPKDPKRNQPVKFFVTFLNTTGLPKPFRWRILVFPPDAKNAKGDTSPLDYTIAVGTSELASMDNWTIRGPGPCEDYFARVFWLDENKQAIEFLKPDRSGGPAAGFQICP